MKKIFKKVTLFSISLITLLSTITNSSAYVDGKYYARNYGTDTRFIDDNTYVNIYNKEVKLTNDKPSDWFSSYFDSMFKIKWIESPTEEILKIEASTMFFDIDKFSNPEKEYPMINTEYEQISSQITGIDEMLHSLSATGSWIDANILDGIIKDNGTRDYDLYDTLTRGQVAKMLSTANNSWYKVEDTKVSKSFEDVPESLWSKPFIEDCWKKCFMVGTGENTFSPEDNMTREQFMKAFFEVTMQNPSYSIEDFVSAINTGDIAKIIEVKIPEHHSLVCSMLSSYPQYYAGTTKTDGILAISKDYDLKPGSVLYENNTAYLLKDSENSFHFYANICSYLTGRIGPISAVSSDPTILYVLDNGIIDVRRPGECIITIYNEYGFEQELRVVIYSHASEFKINSNYIKSTEKINVNVLNGETVDLKDYINNDEIIHVRSLRETLSTFDGVSKITTDNSKLNTVVALAYGKNKNYLFFIRMSDF